MFKGLIFIKAPHDNEPIDNRRIPSDREAARRCSQRQHFEIDIRCKPAVKVEFRPARRLPPLQSREVEIRKVDRLLQFVDPIAGEEYPGHMGLARDYIGHCMRISAVVTEKVYFLGKRGLF